jgi:membrane-bound ClpP family serine protease
LTAAGTRIAPEGTSIRNPRLDRTPASLQSAIITEEGVVQAPFEPVGTVQLGGETWSARTPGELPLPRDTPVRLLGFDGLIAIVEPLEPAPPIVVPAPAASLPAERT